MKEDSKYLKIPKCMEHPEVPYPELWQVAFSIGNDKNISCGETCNNPADFRCYYFFSEGGVIKNLFGLHDGKPICPLPHLTYETCRKSTALVVGRSKDRSAFRLHKEDFHRELCAHVFEQGCKENSVPPNFFKWLDGCLKNGWQDFERESEIGKKKDLVGQNVRRYQIFSLTLTGLSKSRAEVYQRQKEIKKELKLLNSKVFPVDSPEDAELAASIRKLGEELDAIRFEYVGVGEQVVQEDYPQDDLESAPSLLPGPEELFSLSENLSLLMLKQCLSSLKQVNPDLYETANVTRNVMKVRIRRGKNGCYQFNDCDIARELSVPMHIARRRVEKAEKWLSSCMKSKGYTEEHSND